MSRLLVRVVLGAFCFVGLVAGAQAETVWYYWNGTKTLYATTSADSTCRLLYSNSSSASKYNYVGPTYNAAQTVADCMAKLISTGGNSNLGTIYKRVCPSSTPYWNYDTSVCQAQPYAPVEPDPVCTKGEKKTLVWKLVDSNGKALAKPPYQGSSDGACKVDLVDVTKCYLGTDNAQYCVYVGEKTGEPLKASDDTPAPLSVEAPGEVERTPAPPGSVGAGTACPKGTVAGGYAFDGKTVACIGTGSAPTNPKPAPPTTTSSQTTTNADGSTTTTTTTTQTNADGSKTTTVDKVTTSPAGTVTKEQTKDTTPTPGGAPGRETDPKEQDSFCKQNPTLAVCRNSEVKGSCEQTTCMGDAIQCATLQAARAMECKARQDEADVKGSALHQLGQAAATGNDPGQGTLPTPGNGEVIQVSALKAEGWLGGGSPLKDATFSIQGKSITIPFSKASEYLLALRYALMVVASLISFRMLSGVILRD